MDPASSQDAGAALEVERRAWIVFQLRLHGLTLRSLGRSLGLAPTTPGQALWRPYPRMERVIADAIGLEPEDIWPERYGRIS